jgi:hypothetical protein
MLADVRVVFGEEEKLASSVLCENLAALEESPWGDWKGKPLEPRGFGRLVRAYGIKSEQLWLDGKNVHGYSRERFEDAWNRYLAPETPSRTLEPIEPASEAGLRPLPRTLDEDGLADSESPATPDEKPRLAVLASLASNPKDGSRFCPSCSTPNECDRTLTCAVLAKTAEEARAS